MAKKKRGRPARWKHAVQELSAQLRDIYGQRLKAVIVYGSRARGEAAEDADVDTMIVLEPLRGFWREFSRISPIASRISLKYDLVISAIPTSKKQFETRSSPFFINVRREGVRVG